MFGLNPQELRQLKRLSTPVKIQDFLDTLPVNWEKKGETYMSPRRVLRERKAHCFEGALLAAAALWLQGHNPLLMDLKIKGDDYDHVVALYRINGYWGAISKTNHATLRFRDPVYKTLRELAMSYFHEYFLDTTGRKVLRSYSKPFNLKRYGIDWITTEEDLFDLVDALDENPHIPLVTPQQIKLLRPADTMERKAGKLNEWKRSHPHT